MLLSLVHLAAAGPIFLSTGPETRLDVDGNWPRVFAADGGWYVFNAAAGDYHYQFVNDDLSTDRGSRRSLTGRVDLQDHAITRCPDGSWLHAATGSSVETNDSATLFHYDSSLRLLNTAAVAVGDTAGTYADVPIACTESFRGMGYWADAEGEPMRFVQADASGNVSRRVDLQAAPTALGSTYFEDQGQLYALGFSGKTDDTLHVTWYDQALDALGYVDVDVTDEGWTGYWSQGAVRVGNVYVVVHMASEDRFRWDTQSGDMWLVAFDLDWNMIDRLQLSRNTAPNGGMQPAIAIKDGRILAVYSRDLNNYAYEVSYDGSAAAQWQDPTPDEDPGLRPGDLDENGDVIEYGGCGCDAGSVSGLALLPGALLWLGRRRRKA